MKSTYFFSSWVCNILKTNVWILFMFSFDNNPLSLSLVYLEKTHLLRELRCVSALNLLLIFQTLVAINVTPWIPHNLVFAADFFCTNSVNERADLVFSRLHKQICLSSWWDELASLCCRSLTFSCCSSV